MLHYIHIYIHTHYCTVAWVTYNLLVHDILNILYYMLSDHVLNALVRLRPVLSRYEVPAE